MEIAEIIALGLKLSIEAWAAYAKTQGMNETEIVAVLQQTQSEFLARDPANLPN